MPNLYAEHPVSELRCEETEAFVVCLILLLDRHAGTRRVADNVCEGIEFLIPRRGKKVRELKTPVE